MPPKLRRIWSHQDPSPRSRPSRPQRNRPPGPAQKRLNPGPIAVGSTNDRAKGAVTLEAAELTRHAAFLGGDGER